MKTEKTNYVYKPVQYFTITFLLTWITGFIVAYLSYPKGIDGIQFPILIFGLCAPTTAALIMIFGSKNKDLKQEFFDKLRLRRMKLGTLPAIFLIMPFALFLATAVSVLFGHSANQFMLAKEYQIINGQMILSLLILFLAPTFEELGWRGYAIDSIRVRFNLFNTSLIFGAIWAIWHLPLFFINGYYQHELWDTSIVYVINFFVSIIPATFIMNWIYEKNNNNITSATLFHFMLNLMSVLFQTEQFTKCIITVILSIIAIVIVVRDKEMFFGKEKIGLKAGAPSLA